MPAYNLYEATQWTARVDDVSKTHPRVHANVQYLYCVCMAILYVCTRVYTVLARRNCSVLRHAQVDDIARFSGEAGVKAWFTKVKLHFQVGT